MPKLSNDNFLMKLTWNFTTANHEAFNSDETLSSMLERVFLQHQRAYANLSWNIISECQTCCKACMASAKRRFHKVLWLLKLEMHSTSSSKFCFRIMSLLLCIKKHANVQKWTVIFHASAEGICGGVTWHQWWNWFFSFKCWLKSGLIKQKLTRLKKILEDELFFMWAPTDACDMRFWQQLKIAECETMEMEKFH